MISNIFFYLVCKKNTEYYRLIFSGGHFKIEKFTHFCYIFRVLQRLIGKMDSFKILRKNHSENNIILSVKYQRRTCFTFSLMSLLIVYSYSASFYDHTSNVKKAKRQRSSTEQRKKSFENKIFLYESKLWYFNLYFV